MKRLMALILLLFATAPALSSKIIGNGGDVSVCINRTPKVQLLDFVESRVLRKNHIKLWNPPGATYSEKLEVVLERLGRRFPEFTQLLKTEIANFEEKNVKESDIELEDINDSLHKFRLPGCHVEQIANQSIPLFDDDPWFLINANLWNQLEEFDKAGLVLHEVIYRIGLRHGVEHSIGVRYLVSLIFQEKPEAVSDQQWVQAFMHSRMQFFETANIRFPLFRGAEKVCEVVPGAIECKNGDPEFKAALVHFNSDRSLSNISFENVGSEVFSWTSPGEYSAIINTDRMAFEWLPVGVNFSAQGRLQLRQGNAIETLNADVRGKFNPLNGTFTGEYRLVRWNQPSSEHWTSFDGSLKEFFKLRPASPINPSVRQPR